MAASGGHWKSGHFVAAGQPRGDEISPAKRAAMQEGRELPVEPGDFIWSRSLRGMGGTVLGEGTLGRTNVRVYRVRTWRGREDIVPVNDAILAGGFG